jgi:hypothetical protein
MTSLLSALRAGSGGTPTEAEVPAATEMLAALADSTATPPTTMSGTGKATFGPKS